MVVKPVTAVLHLHAISQSIIVFSLHPTQVSCSHVEFIIFMNG